MKTFVLIVTCLAINVVNGYSFVVNPDSVKLENIEFDSDIEKRLFEEYFTGTNTDLFSLFYAAGCTDNYTLIVDRKAAFDRNIVDYKSEKFLNYKPEKRAKIIYSDIHEKYFKKYELEIMFNDIFSTGNYNCVTASALFALCFDKLKYKYEIKLTPNHVYLVLFPGGQSIRVETTNPTIGNYIIDGRMKKQYINYLVDSKIISQQEFQEKSIEKLFDEYYLAEETVSLENLVGVLYYNYGLSFFNEGDYLKAFNQFEKARLFYPDSKVKFMCMGSLNNYFIEKGVNTAADLKFMMKYSNLAENENERKFFLELFKVYTQNVLIEKGNFDSYIEGFKFVRNNLYDSASLAEAGFIYSYELGRSYFNTGQYDKSQKQFEEAYKLKPSNLDAQSALIQILSRKLASQNPVEVLYNFEYYYNNFGDMRKNNAFCSLYSTVCLAVSSDYFKQKNPQAANAQLSKFEELYSMHKNLDVNSYVISNAYTSAAVFYFGQGKEKLAKSYIDKGLTILPNDFDLLQIKHSF